MTDPEREKILARVRKMLALGKNRGATEGERDNALRMARATLEKYNLDLASVEESTHKPTAGEERVEKEGRFYGRPWARAIAVAAADLCFCSYLYVGARRGSDTRHCFIGRTSNAITALELAQYLVESVHREAKRHQRQHYLGNDSYRAFAWGAASAIRQRVRDLRAASEKAAQQESSAPKQADAPQSTEVTMSKALVVIQANEAAANRQFIEQHYGKKLGSGRSGQGFNDGDSAARGRAYGQTVSLNRQVGGSDRPRLK